ncbi:stress response transcriptional regulator NmlR [Streptococcus cristatus]|uniref:Transcriptional regulator, MerR family n=1 Tax=Streptococcus cristatus TaxID=45634 RepID=A0A139N4C8_STRCR|nr:stress response transcriptional regulator NmlR [Streptococcus cristatus]KXT70889.1 transcriptional regulator, MerR family [Streptococcus cristatus]
MNIKSASQTLGLSADTIRYYERIGLVPPITRSAAGIRDFQASDMEALEFVKCFRSAGVSVESLIAYMALYQEGDATKSARLDILLDERDKLAQRISELETALHRLDRKITYYQKETAK